MNIYNDIKQQATTLIMRLSTFLNSNPECCVSLWLLSLRNIKNVCTESSVLFRNQNQCSYLGYLKCEAVNREIYADDSLSAIYYSLAIKKIGGKKDFLGGVQFHLFFPWFKKKRIMHTTTIMKESKLPHMLKHFLATKRPML